MIKTVLASAVALGLVFGVSGNAFADSFRHQSTITGQPGTGNQSCANGKNPGQFIQYYHYPPDQTTAPGQLAKSWEEPLGAIIQSLCGA